MKSFEVDGVKFNWTYEIDHGRGLPWDENGGHGIVYKRPANSSYDESPGKAVIFNDGVYRWTYDVQGSVLLAKEECWGLEDVKALRDKLGRQPTSEEIRTEAVRLDMEFCRRYLEGQVRWFTVFCWPADDSDAIQYVGGICCEKSDSYLKSSAVYLAKDYFHTVKHEKEALAKQAAREAELDLIMAGL